MENTESLKPFMDLWLEQIGIGKDETLYVVSWNYPGRDGIGDDDDFKEVVKVSRDKGVAASTYVEHDQGPIQRRNKDRLETERPAELVELDSLDFESISREELARRLACAVFCSTYSFGPQSMDQL